MTLAGECLDENRASAFFAGKLDGAAVAAVELHVDSCADCRHLLSEMARTFLARASTTSPNPSESGAPMSSTSLLATGDAIGRYIVIERVGAGGMGFVYSAYDPELGRRVALKVLRHISRDTGLSEKRLLREAQVLARLVHPNVVTVYDVGTFAGQVFLAMELIDGGTVFDWLREAPRQWRPIRDVFLGAGRGLIAAHEAGIVHRDFKPENVLVGKDGRVCVTDFGLSRAPGDNLLPAGMPLPSASPGKLTESGAVMGTPAYMAPEQRRGVSDERSDQYSFCVALCEALDGQLPAQQQIASTVRPSLPPVPSVPRRIRRAIARGLSPQPADRYPTMAALVRDLHYDPAVVRRRWAGALALVGIAGLALLAVERAAHHENLMCTGAALELSDAWSPAKRSAITAAFNATAAPYAASAAATTNAALDSYAQRWAAMRIEACQATHLRGEQSAELLDLRMACLDRRAENLKALVDVLGHADKGVVSRAVSAVEQLPELDACQDAVALKSTVRLPTDPTLRKRIAELREKLANATALTQTGKYADAVQAAQAILPAAQATGYAPLQAEALFVAGAAENSRGDYKIAEQHFADAALRANAARDDLTTALAWARLVMVVGFNEARYDEGLRWAMYARSQLERLGGNPRVEAVVLLAEGTIYAEQGKYELAQAAHEHALHLQEKLQGADSTDVAVTLLHLGFDHFARGERDQALAAYQRSFDIREKRLGPNHPLCATSLINVGNVYYQRGDLPRAAADYQRALAIQEAALGPDNVVLADSLTDLGNVFSDQKDWARATAAYQRALTIDEHTFGPEHPSLAAPISNLGDVYLAQARYPAARVQYERALTIRTKALGPDHPALARALTNTARTYIAEGAFSKAIPLCERAVALRAAHPGDPVDLAEARFVAATAIVQSDPRRAHELAQAARATYVAAAGHKAELDEVDAWLVHHR